jgi:hypothetical protein
LSEEPFALLTQATERSYETFSELLKDRLIDLLEDPPNPFDPRVQHQRQTDEEFRRRIASSLPGAEEAVGSRKGDSKGVGLASLPPAEARCWLSARRFLTKGFD